MWALQKSYMIHAAVSSVPKSPGDCKSRLPLPSRPAPTVSQPSRPTPTVSQPAPRRLQVAATFAKSACADCQSVSLRPGDCKSRLPLPSRPAPTVSLRRQALQSLQRFPTARYADCQPACAGRLCNRCSGFQPPDTYAPMGCGASAHCTAAERAVRHRKRRRPGRRTPG